MNVSPGTKIDEQLRKLIVRNGWHRDITTYAIVTIDSQFDEVWCQATFDKIAGGGDIGRYIIERGQWKDASPAFRYYVQVC